LRPEDERVEKRLQRRAKVCSEEEEKAVDEMNEL
jgi:hypothetical protein